MTLSLSVKCPPRRSRPPFWKGSSGRRPGPCLLRWRSSASHLQMVPGCRTNSPAAARVWGLPGVGSAPWRWASGIGDLQTNRPKIRRLTPSLASPYTIGMGFLRASCVGSPPALKSPQRLLLQQASTGFTPGCGPGPEPQLPCPPCRAAQWPAAPCKGLGAAPRYYLQL